ncbi:TIGR04222 domain-containing membrane protein [Actinomadura hibisca]|uniref:TIGR04222 domain-containing membrane protein n=1 Tax=Actinomadura hibisca TaxID=68565 RepID=UPI0008337DA3|nr:TIGR04222 domain-containing membrane protein [Actinomadura hibisca]
MALSAAGETWGIPGPQFIGIFVPLAVVLTALALHVRRAMVAGRPPEREPGPYELAYLEGGGERAVLAALARLRAEGAVETAGRGSVRATSAPRDSGNGLDGVVHARLLREPMIDSQLLEHRADVAQELAELRKGLEHDGLLIGEDARRRRRIALLPLAALALLGAVRIFFGVRDGHPVLFLVAAVLVLLVVLGVLAADPVAQEGRPTEEGRRALADAKDRHRHLRPDHTPAWATYGAAGAGLGVALFGMTALTSLDPAFAHDALTRPLPPAPVSDAGAAAAGGGGGCGGGDGGGDGGGCGGGCGGCGGCGG